MQRIWKRAAVAAVMAGALAGFGCRTAAELPLLSEWPAGASPKEVGKRLAENFAARPFEFETVASRQYVIYPEVCAWYGSLNVARLTHDTDLEKRLIKKFDTVTASTTNRISSAAHVDYHVFGVVPLEIYKLTHDPKFLALGRSFADLQWTNPSPDGITREARYWIDDMYMITALEVQAYRATKDSKYLDRAALTMSVYLDRLQQTNGLFLHALDSPFYWSRGNGWVAAGMTELLRSLPPSHPKYGRIMEGYRKMMAALLQYQGEDGLWRQLIDHPEAWVETSGTGMFAFAIVTGVKQGWLDAATYGPSARKAWLGLVKYLDKDANVSNVCVGTNKGFSVAGRDLNEQLKYYLERDRRTGDLHGQSAMLWTAAALLRP